MPGPFGGIRVTKGGPGWRLDWDGAAVMIKAARAAQDGINECMALAVIEARSHHRQYPPTSEPYETFANRTDQTIEATQILEPAEIKGWIEDRPYVTGRWGIRDGPAFQDPDEWREVRGFTNPPEGGIQEVTIVDRAMFLEFGSARPTLGPDAYQFPRPFIYPAWDATKHLLPGLIAAAYRRLGGGRFTRVGL